MKATEVFEFTVEEVNGNDVWNWSIYGNIKPGQLIVCTDGENERFFIIYSEEIDYESMELMVEELTESDFNSFAHKYKYEIFRAECLNLFDN